jgi:hypothetical protein
MNQGSVGLASEFREERRGDGGRQKIQVFQWIGMIAAKPVRATGPLAGPTMTARSCVTPFRVDPIRAMPSEERRGGDDDDAAQSVSERPSGKKKKRTKPPIPRTEREIDAPDRLTLLMLGVMCVMTVVLWAFAKGGCNYHPPRETKRPRALKTEELARDPKDAALEMQQRLVQYDFKGALELVADSAEAEVKKRETDCAAKVAQCAENKKKQERTTTAAALLERDMGSALVRATSFTPGGGKQANIHKLERRGQAWKVVSFSIDDGSYKPKAPEPMELMPTPGPSGAVPPGANPMEPPPSGHIAIPPPGSSATLRVPIRVPPSAAAPPAPPPKAPPAAPAASK